MNRRTFLCGLTFGAIGTPIASQAQQGSTVWRIGWLGDGTRAAREANTLTPLREGLRELGYVEGRNIFIDARWSDGDSERLTRDAGEFVRQKVDVIVSRRYLGGHHRKKATATTPIVIATAAYRSRCTAVYSRRAGRVTGSSLDSEWVTVTSDLRPALR